MDIELESPQQTSFVICHGLDCHSQTPHTTVPRGMEERKLENFQKDPKPMKRLDLQCGEKPGYPGYPDMGVEPSQVDLCLSRIK